MFILDQQMSAGVPTGESGPASSQAGSAETEPKLRECKGKSPPICDETWQSVQKLPPTTECFLLAKYRSSFPPRLCGRHTEPASAAI